MLGVADEQSSRTPDGTQVMEDRGIAQGDVVLVWPVSRPPVLEHEKKQVVYTPVKKKPPLPQQHLDVIWANGLGVYSIVINSGGLVALFHVLPFPCDPFVCLEKHFSTFFPPTCCFPIFPYLSPPSPLVFILFCRELCYDKALSPRLYAVSAGVMPL